MALGWHRSGYQRAADGLFLSWTLQRAEGEYRIYQGRPDGPASTRFVYRLVRPDGVAVEYRLLLDAKRGVD